MCPNGTYPTININTTINICANCNIGCTYCISSTICNICGNGYYLYNNICGVICPTDITIANNTIHVC